MDRYVIGPLRDFPAGSKARVHVAGRPIAVFNVEGSLFALKDQCPHQGGPLSAGNVVGKVESPLPGVYEYDQHSWLVKCPWHGWEYDLETGQSWCDPARDRVHPYPVAVESGKSVTAALETAGSRLRGPYVVETFVVSVEDEYVVIDLQT